MSPRSPSARRADENHHREARALVAEERVRIARELHDVVAHHIAVINVHAGLARRAVGRDAGTVDTSLGHVQEAARTVLTADGGKVVWAVLDAPQPRTSTIRIRSEHATALRQSPVFNDGRGLAELPFCAAPVASQPGPKQDSADSAQDVKDFANADERVLAADG